MPETYTLGDCDNCGTENVLVHSGIHGRAKYSMNEPVEERTSNWCYLCRSLIRPEDENSINVAILGNRVIKQLAELKAQLDTIHQRIDDNLRKL